MTQENSNNAPIDGENSSTSTTASERLTYLFGDCVPLSPEALLDRVLPPAPYVADPWGGKPWGTRCSTSWDGEAPRIPSRWKRDLLMILLGWGLGAISGVLLLIWLLD